MDSLEFLNLVWGRQHCFVDLPSKIAGHWIPYSLEWPDERALVGRRIASCLEDEEDVYFSVARFRTKGRRIQDVLPTHWLWADLDKVDPVFLDEDHVLPTLAWQSSEGRYQCLWRMDRQLRPAQQSLLNQRLTYAIGADKTGYDLTQVLRPPGTFNHKYHPRHEVELLWYNPGVEYSPKDMIRRVMDIDKTNGFTDQRQAEREAVERQLDTIGIPARARRLLRTPASMVVTGERSAKLWELEMLLAERGFNEDQIFELVEPCAWNKHKEVASGDRRLREEIRKAIKKADARRSRRDVESSDEDTDDGVSDLRERDDRGVERPDPVLVRTSPFVGYAQFLSTHIEAPRWLIEDIWSGGSHGIVGGEPKTSKSTFTLAMGLSVATGVPFLGTFQVPASSVGPVLMIQEENAPWVMQDRLRKLASYSGLIPRQAIEVTEARAGAIAAQTVRLDFPQEAPFRFLNNYGFDLTDDEDRDLLEEEVRREGARMVILDPLYLLMGGTNVNAQHEVGPLMQWLMALRYNHNCAVVVVHHWHKATESTKNRRPGQRLMGSGILHGWVESGIYMEQVEAGVEGNGGGDSEGIRRALQVRVEREFRNVAPRGPIDVSWELGEPGTLDLDINVSDSASAGSMVADLLYQAGPQGMALSSLCKELGVDRARGRAMVAAAGGLLQSRKSGRGTGWQAFAPGYRGGGADDSPEGGQE